MKINPNVYKKAANYVDYNMYYAGYHRGACHCISLASEYESISSKHIKLFDKYFNPKNDLEYWFGERTNSENQLSRELALDLMALIAKDLK